MKVNNLILAFSAASAGMLLAMLVTILHMLDAMNTAYVADDPNYDPFIVTVPACETDGECELLDDYLTLVKQRDL